MKCPRTGATLRPVVIDGIEVDLSLGCGGVWFDQFELAKFDEVHEGAGKVIIEHMETHHKPLTAPASRCRTPLCHHKISQIICHKIWRFYDGFATLSS